MSEVLAVLKAATVPLALLLARYPMEALYVVFGLYVVLVLGLSWWTGRKRKER